jgi:hypothetical protein
MRWYFGLDESGAAGLQAEHARLAVLSAKLAGELEPRLLYYGARNDLTRWMERQGVAVIDAEPPCLDAMREAQSAGRFHAHSIGHWLRLAIPSIDRDAEEALYTDCDVVFRRRLDFSAAKPQVFAAAPEFCQNVWNYFNSGVMLMSLRAMRATAPALEAELRRRLAGPDAARCDDQVVLNEAYRGRWERLDPGFNWKPYWRFEPRASILHFHGPKLAVIEAISDGSWHANDATARSMLGLLDAHLPHYAAWLADLGDQLQLADAFMALRLQNIAAKLARHAAHSAVPSAQDLSFMQFRMFPE